MKATERHKLIDRIKTIEGLTDDERSALLGMLRETKTYGLVWEDKPEAVEERLRTELPVLIEDKGRAITSGGGVTNYPSTNYPNHILIEGDNLEALTTLAYTHAGKIDVIYIDPPYNTGNKDFIYNDSYVDAEDSYRHSKWLSFMARRLRIAKRLLSDRGVIFISIDDNEQANLKLLCDEIFGESNFLGQLILKTATDNNPSQLNNEHEYMLCYCKNRAVQGNWQRQSIAAKRIVERYKELLETYEDLELVQKELRKWIRSNKASLPQVAHYNNVDDKGVYSSSGNSSNPHPGGYMYDIFHPETGLACPKPANGWRWPEATFKRYDSDGEIEWGIDHTTQPHVKKRIETSTEYLRTLIYEDNRGTTKALMEMFDGEKVFDNPKPYTVLARILDFSSCKDSIVLDFFAGSGTTLHAVMQLNAEDGGHRQCILCTNNENGICENVTYERNRRVIQGYTKPNGEFVEGLHNNNLRYYRTAFVGRTRSIKNMRRLVALSTDMLCIKENLYTEKKTFAGTRTFKNIFRYFDNGEKRMLIIYDERYVDEIVGLIAKDDADKPIKVYVFSPSEDPWEASFEPVADKVELCALPQAIYNTYMRILPKRRPQPLDDNAGTHHEASDDDEDALGGLFDTEKGGNE